MATDPPDWRAAARAAAAQPEPDWLIALLLTVGLPYERTVCTLVNAYRWQVLLDGELFEANRLPFVTHYVAAPWAFWLVLLRPCPRCGAGAFRSPGIRSQVELGVVLEHFAPAHAPACPSSGPPAPGPNWWQSG